MKETIPQTMTAALLTGHGGFDRLEYRQDVSVPAPKTDEVLIRVLACGINNTDVNTRIGWYSKSEQVLALGAGRVYPLEKIVSAQKDFLSKTHTGKLVMTPPSEV